MADAWTISSPSISEDQLYQLRLFVNLARIQSFEMDSECSKVRFVVMLYDSIRSASIPPTPPFIIYVFVYLFIYVYLIQMKPFSYYR